MGSFSMTHWLIFGAVVFVFYKATKGLANKDGAPMFCKACGHEGATKTSNKGSIWIELVLWLCFLVPGLIYSIWRLTNKTRACTSCGSSDLVPPNSPMALSRKKLFESNHA